MKKQFSLITALLIGLMLVVSPLASNAEVGKRVPQQQHKKCISKNELKLHDDMRKLWEEHYKWTSRYITSAVSNLPDKDVVLARLMHNQEDIGNLYKAYYGVSVGDKLTALLKEHIAIAGKIIEAGKVGDQANLKKLNDDWFKNADDITDLLSSINKHYNKLILKGIFHKHLQMVTDEAVARIKMDWQASVNAADAGEDHIMKLADFLSNGIVKQFPARFK